MRYRLRTLLIVLALGPPILAVIWDATHSIWAMIVYAVSVSFFGFWYDQLLKRQAMHPRTRGEPSEF